MDKSESAVVTLVKRVARVSVGFHRYDFIVNGDRPGGDPHPEPVAADDRSRVNPLARIYSPLSEILLWPSEKTRTHNYPVPLQM